MALAHACQHQIGRDDLSTGSASHPLSEPLLCPNFYFFQDLCKAAY